MVLPSLPDPRAVALLLLTLLLPFPHSHSILSLFPSLPIQAVAAVPPDPKCGEGQSEHTWAPDGVKWCEAVKQSKGTVRTKEKARLAEASGKEQSC